MAEQTFFQRVLNIKPNAQKNSNMMGYFGVGTQDAKTYKYQDLAKEGYLKNAIVYRCVNEISKGASAVPFVIKAGEQIVEQHPLIDLLNRPNPLQSYSEFFNSLFGYVLLSGNAYILKVGGITGTPKELHQLRPDRINIKGSGSAIPDEYEYIVLLYAAAKSCQSAAVDIQNNMPTKPEAPTAPSFESVHFEVELPAEPIYSPPVLELSQFNFESIRTHILKGDFDMADKLLGVVDKKVEEYEKQEKQEKQNYDRMQKIFDTKLQTLEKNKEREFNIKAGDYRSQIYKYQYDINEYQSELQEITTKYKWFMEQYVTLMNEYNKGISSVPAPVQGPRGQGQIQAKPAKEPEGGE